MNKSILVLDVISQVVSALLVVSGPSEHGRQRLLSFTHAGGLEPKWRPMHELFVCSHYVPFDIYISYIHISSIYHPYIIHISSIDHPHIHICNIHIHILHSYIHISIYHLCNIYKKCLYTQPLIGVTVKDH